MRDVQPKELTVSKSDSPRSVHLNGILVVLPDFDDLIGQTCPNVLAHSPSDSGYGPCFPPSMGAFSWCEVVALRPPWHGVP